MTTCEPGASEVLTQGLGLRPSAPRLLRDQARADHHVGVRGVGAGGDRGDHHVAVAEIVSRGRRPARAGPSGGSPARGQRAGQLLGEGGGGVGQQHVVLRALGPGHGGLRRRQVELQRVGEDRVGVVSSRHMPWALA